jgi:hypothetical protein
MSLAELQRKLVAAARANAPGDGVPYAFEKRIMALLPSRAATNNLVLWAHGLWRAAASCAAITLLLGAWVSLNPTSGASANDLSQNFENTLLAAVDQNVQTQ